MSEYVENTPVEDTPVEEAPAEEAPAEEAPAEETPVEEESTPAEEVSVEEYAPAEEAPAEEEPAEEAPAEEAPAEEAPAEEAPAEEAQQDAPIEQVVSDIREILTPVDNEVQAVETESVIICSLKTLVDVLGKWSSNEIERRQVEDLLRKDSEVDENLDDLEKVVEILDLWIGKGGWSFRRHNHFLKFNEYTLVGESINLSDEKKVEVLKTITELTINASQRKIRNGEIINVINNLW